MNYKTMSRNFICKMAMPLALMFAACSTEDGNAVSKVEGTPGPQMGGSSEEPSVIAYENISLMARAYYAPAGNEAGSSEDVSVSVPQNAFLDAGRVTLMELDSVSLAPFGDTSFTVAINDGGTVRFDSVSLRSPIVSFEAVSGSISLKAIVDVRDTGMIIVDGVSHLAAYRIEKLAEAGMSFAAARTQAGTEIATALGFGAEPQINSSTEALWRKAFSEVLPFTWLERLKGEFGETGTLTGLLDNEKETLVKRVESSYIFTVLQVSSRAFERLGDSAVQYYQDCLQRRAYFANLLASVFGYGACSSEKEGQFADIHSGMYELKCESDAWKMTIRQANKVSVAHTFGTMTDSRDAKTYKTVQLDLGDVSQTWMAENLNYETENSSCFKEEFFTGEMSYCSSYGRIYSFVARLDSSYRKYTTKEGCVDVKTLEYLNESSSDDTLYWRGRAEEDCDVIYEYGGYRDDSDNILWEKVADSLESISFDVCPEGWRMPQYEDWAKLFLYLRSHFGVEPGKELNYLLSWYGNPVGFSMDYIADIRGDSDWYRIGVRSVPYLFAPKVLSEGDCDSTYDFSNRVVYGSIVYAVYATMYNVNHYHELKQAYGRPEMGFVRCIKDE
jgi:uncharacterized protein (TIGR02145 family)